MPRTLNPSTLTVGHGKPAPDENVPRPSLTGAGLPGPGPNIGQPVVPFGSIPGGPIGESFTEHVQDPKGAHAAAAIEHDGYPDVLLSGTVEGALDELIGAVTQRPPYLGQWQLGMEFTGIPDWGYLKLRDASLDNYPLVAAPPAPLANLPAGVSPALIFPYYFSAPGPAQDMEFVNEGEDPRTDWVWNTGLELTSSLGMGYGRCHLGAFTRGGGPGAVAPLPVYRTARLYPRPTGNDPLTGKPYRVPVTLSGSIFPADRGVLALLHFPPARGPGAMQAEFLGQPLITDHTVPGSLTGRVVAALVLGNGLGNSNCFQGACATVPQCDGSPGGIFGLGTDPVTDQYEPFAYPGRATGQYNLAEIHTGLTETFSDLCRPPWNDFHGTGGIGAKRAVFDVIPAPGQVRLGTDPDAGETPVPYGIPILGGTEDYFDIPPVAQADSLGQPISGDSLILHSNHFAYRLPVLQDYSPATGLKWTPRADGAITGLETCRYFNPKATVSTTYPDGTTVGATLRSAGFYEAGFDADYWVWQVARYRHTFLMPSIQVGGLREEVGSYWLVHFKKEGDFEKFAHLGIFPWHATEGYEVYGFSLAGAPPVHIEEDKNVVNEWPDATAPLSPDGPAPEYGYAANPYHEVRSTIFLDPAGTALPAITGTYDYASTSVPAPGAEGIMWVSGVAYFTPLLADTGAQALTITALDIAGPAGFWTSYRTDQKDLTVEPATAPAILASVNPLFVGMASWAYGPGTGGLPIPLTVPTGAPGAGLIPDTDYLGTHRIEVPFQYMGTTGGNPFDDANGPLDADTIAVALPSPISPLGDTLTPVFTRDAKIRAYFRRPMNHLTDNATTLPYAANDGHGEVCTPISTLTVLYHSTKFDKTTPANGNYGNYVVAPTGAVPPANTSYASLVALWQKDVGESFLDEVYRCPVVFPVGIIGAGGNPYTAAAVNSLHGPGMQGWVGGPIEVPVKVAYATTPWDEASWLLMEHHLGDLSGALPEELTGLQVAGLPDRNPPQSACVQVPFPSAGVLIYPQEDFTGVDPSAAYFASVQPDYSAVTGLREYVRTLDTAFINRGPTYVLSPGRSTAVLRIDGIKLEDLAFTAPGPGGVTDNRVAISVKVPGLTTWMDVGRPDGAGPAKQDMFADGAGCQVAGPETYDFIDPVTGYHGCYIKVNVGPLANLFGNTATWAAYVATWSPLNECPLMLRVQIDDTGKGFNLANQCTAPGVFAAAHPGLVPTAVRGIFGIKVQHPLDALLDPA